MQCVTNGNIPIIEPAFCNKNVSSRKIDLKIRP